MKWIDAGDIKNWITGKQRHCQQILPELVRRLILATASSIEEIDFPSGDSIATGGWDGRLKTSVVVPFFPNGTSGWEIGTEKSPGNKAKEDYAKRTTNPLGFAPKDTTFVFVTPRSWPGRGKWQNDMRATKAWKNVRVINADGLEQWLDSVPAVALWMARQIGKVVSGGIRDLEAFWEEWSVGTNPVMTADLVISGRTKDMEEIQKWIGQRPRILEVQGDHPDEAFAFLYAAIAALPETERAQAFARCVVVENINELRQLIQAFQNYPLIIAVPGECIDAAPAATAKGHHVFISMDAKTIGIIDVLRLSRPQRSIVEKILHDNGFPDAEAQRLARDFGRSIPVLRRHLFRSHAVGAPAWTNVTSAQILIPTLLAGSWNENKEGDRQVIEKLSGMKDYDTFIKKLTPFLSIDDSPIRKIGSVWMLKSPLDAWFLLATHLSNKTLELFRQSVLTVLTKTDPKYDLPTEQRWAAAIYGKSNPYSEWLRTSLVESLVLLAVYDNRSPNVVSTQAFANHVVKEIFTAADKWEVWASLKDVTPLLAEAAPGSFIEAVEQGIAKKPKIFQELMQDDSGAFGECKHSGLLWALEGMAWSSDYFGGAVKVLSKLANIDLGGSWNNRAINSLRELFLPRFPQTYATPEERLAVLDTLTIKYPQMVWKFGQSYYSGGIISESHRFRWRDTGGIRRGLEPEDKKNNRKYMPGLLSRLSNLACAKENLISAAEEFTHLSYDVRERLLKVLEEINPNVLLKEERANLFQCVREKLNWLNSYEDKERKTQVPALYRILDKFTPENALERVGWLLSTPWPRLPQGEPKEYDEKNITVKRAQEEAAREVLDKVPLDKIIEFVGTIQYPGILGHALGKVVRDEREDNIVLDALLKHMDKPILIRGYAGGRVEVTGSGWINKQVERIKAQGSYSPEACALLYFGLPENMTTWLAVGEHGKDVENAYWKQTGGYFRTNKSEDALMAVEKLLDVKRPDTALTIASDPHISLPSTLLQRLIQELLVINLKDKKFRADVMTGFHIGHIFKQLYEREELPIEEIAKLEWPFVALFDEIRRYAGAPMALHRVLQKDPSFFAQLISFIYKRDDRALDPSQEGIDKEIVERRARVAYELLDSWHLIPGLKDDGTLDEKVLMHWVEIARKQCAEINRTEGGDLRIAFMLAHAPGDSDGTWPHVAVRNLIERLNNELIDRHIQMGIYNSRGVVSRGLNEGGRQERELAEKYNKMSNAVKTSWPRTGAMLRSIAESYERDAKREDIDSDLHDLRWD